MFTEVLQNNGNTQQPPIQIATPRPRLTPEEMLEIMNNYDKFENADDEDIKQILESEYREDFISFTLYNLDAVIKKISDKTERNIMIDLVKIDPEITMKWSKLQLLKRSNYDNEDDYDKDMEILKVALETAFDDDKPKIFNTIVKKAKRSGIFNKDEMKNKMSNSVRETVRETVSSFLYTPMNYVSSFFRRKTKKK